MNTSLLFTVLLCAMSTGIIAFITLLSKKKDENRFEKITAIATFLTSITTIAVGIATISVAKHQESMEKLQNQPLFSVNINSNQSPENDNFVNEEYIVINEGKKAKSKTSITLNSYLEINYTDNSDPSNYKNITKLIPLINYFGATIYTNNFDGTIQYSLHSKNNLERFVELHKETLKYGELHPGIYIDIRKKHYFEIDYTDIYGDHHRIFKTEESEIDQETYDDIIKKAKKDSDDTFINFDKPNISLDSILKTYFKNNI